MTQDVYLGRRAGNAGNLAALEAYNPTFGLTRHPVLGTNEQPFVPAFVPSGV